jgi:uncharacterized RDD family membrane protein YckC
VFAVSYVCPLWNSRKAALHDVLADTVVVREAVVRHRAVAVLEPVG